MVFYSAAGALWGLNRPRLTGHATPTVNGGAQIAIDTVANVQFASFGWFVILTAVPALALGLLAFARGRDSRGVAMLLWSGAVALAGAAAFYVFGSATAPELEPGARGAISWVPAFSPGVGFAAAPLAAMTSYWSAAFVSAESAWPATAPAQPS
ncbi:hypothetical protein F4V58_04010 [Corynebacterium phocae]|nr:hypothetical protein F4V58_04010 [Corynebacterium phocae]